MSKEIRERLVAVKELVDDYARPNSTTDGGNLYYEMHWLLTTLETTLTKLDVAVEGLEKAIKILKAYADVKIEHPDSNGKEEYLAFVVSKELEALLAKIKGEP